MTDRDEHPAPETNSAVNLPAEEGVPQPVSGPAGRILDAEVLFAEATSNRPVTAAEESSLAVPAGQNRMTAAAAEPARPARYLHPLRFGLKALIALTAVCSAQFALMFYLGTLPGLILTAVLCAGMLVALLLASFVIPQENYQPWAGRLDQLAIRLVLAIVLLLTGVAFAGGGILIVHYVDSVQLAYRVKSDLGFSAEVQTIPETNSRGFMVFRDAIIVKSVRAGGAFHQAGFQKDDTILTDLTPNEYYKMLEENRGSSITVNVASGATGPIMIPIDKCPQRSLVLEIPE